MKRTSKGVEEVGDAAVVVRRAITPESRGDSSIANDLSWTVFFGMIGSRIAYELAWAIKEKR